MMHTETQTTWYHVAHPTYSAGENLYCQDELSAMGIEIEWKFDGEAFDTDVVCLFDNLDDCNEFRSNFCTPDYKILKVTLPEDTYMVKVVEGYNAVPRQIDGRYIEIIEG